MTFTISFPLIHALGDPSQASTGKRTKVPAWEADNLPTELSPLPENIISLLHDMLILIVYFQICVNVLARIFCLRHRILLIKKLRTSAEMGETEEETHHLLNDQANGNSKLDMISMNSRGRENCHCNCTSCPCNVHSEISIMKKSVQSMITILSNTTHKENKKKAIRHEWQCIALAMDRLFFLIYMIAIVFSLSTMFPRPREYHYTNEDL